MEVEQLTHRNLQKFCRLCLRNLRSIGYSIQEHNLATLLILFTSLDLEEEDGAYPKSLCQLCYDSLSSFKQFRSVALQSTKVLYELMSRAQHERKICEAAIGRSENSTINFTWQDKETRKKPTNGYVEHTNDAIEIVKTEQTVPEIGGENLIRTGEELNSIDPLCLPKFSLVEDHPIKTEPDESEEQNEHILPSIIDVYSQFPVQATLKTEIDSEYDEDEGSSFYERNALGPIDDTIADDADDEEYALCNGAANTSTATLNNLNSSTSKQRPNVAVRKRDRSKKSLKCPRCDKQVYKQVYLDAHIRGVHEGYEKPFLCGECRKGFTRYNQLHVHIQTNHQIQQRFICDFSGCGASFQLYGTLETHRQVVHTPDDRPFSRGLQEVFERHQEQLSQEIEMSHICDLCFKNYSSKRALTEHLKRHAQIKDYVCKVCGTAKVTRTELLTHMRTHEPNLEKFKCSICPQEFNHKNAISRHVRVVHEGQRRFSCSFCSKRFGTRNAQVCHERLHTGERPYSCQLCGKSFAQTDALKSHMKSHDTNLRKHICSYCAKRFITRKNLIDHESRHRSNKPHICDVCNRGYFKHEDLVTHRKSHEEISVVNISEG